jgi:hypothetical protein
MEHTLSIQSFTSQFHRLQCQLNVASKSQKKIHEIDGDETNYSQWWFHAFSNALEMS